MIQNNRWFDDVGCSWLLMKSLKNPEHVPANNRILVIQSKMSDVEATRSLTSQEQREKNLKEKRRRIGRGSDTDCLSVP